MENGVADKRIKEAVRQTYGDIARRFVAEPGRASCCDPSQPSCCSCEPSPAAIETTEAAARLYSNEELADLPESVTDIALGCGNPTAIADLRPGEVVLDLGSGGGIDCFLAAKKVGAEGRVIGLDMTPEMIKLARRNAKKAGVSNVEFRYGEMEDMPLPDQSVDVIISNCVINLSPDKDAVFREAFRVLRPGGRMTVSDIVIHGELPESLRKSLDAWAGCLSGALDESDYLGKIRAAGFAGGEVLSRAFVQISQFADWEGVREIVAEAGIAPENLDTTIASIKVKAQKPR